jgi:acyl-CoA reductase-like NAD-dependent aldehyde dehydrogenase
VNNSARQYPFIVGGKCVTPERPVVVRSPFDGHAVGETGDATPAEVEGAIAAADAARGAMAALSGDRRRRALSRLLQLVEDRQQEFADLIAGEAGKPIRDARAETRRGLLTLRTAAEEAARIGGEMMPLDVVAGAEGRFGITRRFPLGVIAGVTPFNFPLNLVLHKLAPALAAGNSLVIKASPRTPLTALRLGELALECDLPAGAVNVISGGADPVRRLQSDSRVAMLSFTGSAAVGWALKASAGRQRITLELGGNAANIVHYDTDVGHAASRLVAGAFGYAGQSCISVQRVLAHERIYPDLKAMLVERARGLRMGDPMDESTDLGPMIDEAAALRSEEWVREAVSAGASLLCGGRRHGSFFEPTILENVAPELRICRDEAFAPVLVLAPYREPEEAIAAANAGRYGLQAGLFTRDLNFVLEAFRQLEVGAIILNDVSSYRLDSMPYGGVKDSGFGREGVRYAIESMTELRLLVVNRG